MTLKALVLYYSPGGNTKKVAEAITRGLESRGAVVDLLALDDAEDKGFREYDLVCLGSPSYNFAVPDQVLRYTKARLREASRHGLVHLGAPVFPGRWAVAFVTYSGPHTGIDEATPAGDHLAQMFRHLGFQVRGIWYTVGEFHDDRALELNLHGFLGDIRGRPDEHDLGVIERNAAGLAFVLAHEKAELSRMTGSSIMEGSPRPFTPFSEQWRRLTCPVAWSETSATTLRQKIFCSGVPL